MVTQKPGTSIPELALDWGISESTLYSLAAQGRLPGCRRLGKRYIVDRATFNSWIQAGTGDEVDAPGAGADGLD